MDAFTIGVVSVVIARIALGTIGLMSLKSEPETVSELKLMKYSFGFQLLVVIFVYMVFHIIWYMFSRPTQTEAIILFIAFTGFLTIFLCIETFSSKVLFNGEILAKKNVIKHTSKKWDDLNQISYDFFTQTFTFSFNDGDKIHVSLYLKGMTHFLRSVKAHISDQKTINIQQQMNRYT